MRNRTQTVTAAIRELLEDTFPGPVLMYFVAFLIIILLLAAFYR
jgi:hypothetical protein